MARACWFSRRRLVMSMSLAVSFLAALESKTSEIQRLKRMRLNTNKDAPATTTKRSAGVILTTANNNDSVTFSIYYYDVSTTTTTTTASCHADDLSNEDDNYDYL